MNTTTIIWVIYLIGFIIVYYIARKQGREIFTWGYDWHNVLSNLGCAIFSWVFLFIYGLILLVVETTEFSGNLLNSKPPKWL